MKRKLLTWIAIVAVALLLLIRILLWLERETIATLITEKIKLSARGIDLVINQPTLHGLNYFAEQVILTTDKRRISFSVNNLTITPRFSKFITGKFGFTLHADAYGGTVGADYTRGLFSGAENVTVNFDRLTLGQHPQLRAFGVRSGYLSGNARDLLCDNGKCTKGALAVTLQELDANLMFLGKVQEGSLLFRSHFTKDGLRIENVNSKSSLLTAEGEGTIPFLTDAELPHPFYLKMQLTALGQQQLKPLLSMFNNDKDLSKTDSFDLYWRGSLQNGQLEVR